MIQDLVNLSLILNLDKKILNCLGGEPLEMTMRDFLDVVD